MYHNLFKYFPKWWVFRLLPVFHYYNSAMNTPEITFLCTCLSISRDRVQEMGLLSPKICLLLILMSTAKLPSTKTLTNNNIKRPTSSQKNQHTIINVYFWKLLLILLFYFTIPQLLENLDSLQTFIGLLYFFYEMSIHIFFKSF